MTNPETERLRAASRRDLADPLHADRSLRASLDRRVAAVRRRRAARSGHSLLAALAALLVLGGAGAVAHQAAGEPEPPERAAATKAGTDVKVLQRKLGVTADGVIGPQTRRAIRRFQKRSGLKADGVPGPATLAALGLPAPAAAPRAVKADDVAAQLARIAQCESGGDPTAVSPDGRYRGKYQFSRPTWRSLGGSGDPAKASEGEQDLRAAALMQRQGPSAWPTCSRR